MNRFEQFTDEELTAIMQALDAWHVVYADDSPEYNLTCNLWNEVSDEDDRRKAEKGEE